MADRIDPLVVASAAETMQTQRPRPRSIISALAERFGCSRRHIGRILASEGIAIKPSSPPCPPKAVLHRLYLVENQPAWSIAQEYGVSTRTAERWLAKNDLRKNGGHDAV